jgi:phosphatidylglycerol:prolipoprotein diacylglycerol transferase
MQRAGRVGLDANAINRLIGWLVVGTFVGGHVGYGLLYAPNEYFANPVEFLKVWHALSSFGGFVACVPLTIWFFRRNNLPVLPYADCVAYGLTIGWCLGRLGCFVAHDHPGTAADGFFLGNYADRSPATLSSCPTSCERMTVPCCRGAHAWTTRP